MPSINGVLETCLYVEDLPRTQAFYQRLMGFTLLQGDERFCALNVADKQVLLLFTRGGTLAPVSLPGGIIPTHDGSGPAHVGFAISVDDLDAWRQRLADLDIPLESTVTWPRGGTSLYFRDPDNHLVELLTPGIWAIY